MNLNFGSTLMMIRWGAVMIFLFIFLFFTSRVIQSLTPLHPPPPLPLEHTRIVRFSTAFIIII